MEAAAFAAQSEAIVFLSYFEDFPDPRQRGKVVYPLNEIPKSADCARQACTVTLCLQSKSSLFWIRLLLVFRSEE